MLRGSHPLIRRPVMSASLAARPSQTWRQRDPGARLPGERSVAEEAADIFADPDAFLCAPHPELGGRSPADCMTAGDEVAVRHLLRRIRYAPVA
jgi:uncharacterized protein (DUF2384 family)